MFEVTYYSILTRAEMISPTTITERVNAVDVLKYLEKVKDKHIIIVSLTLGGKLLNVSMLCSSLKFK